MPRIAALLVAALACNGSEPTAPDPHSGDETTDTTDAPSPPSSPRASRALGPTATFADVVTAARELDGHGEDDADAGCLLRGSGAVGDAWRLEADLAVPLRPLPEPVESLGRVLERHEGPVRVLSRWGQKGGGRRAVASFTMVPPRDGEDLVLFVSGDGLRLRSTGGEVGGSAFPRAELGARLSAARESAGGVLHVTADAAMPLAELRPILAALPEDAVVAFAVLLPQDTRLPAPLVASADTDAGRCPEGLPPTEEPEGQLDPDQAIAALRGAQTRIARCTDYGSAAAARGGELALAIRLASDGSVARACVTEDSIGDPALRACALDAIGEVTFAPPGGVVDLALPLRFEANETERQSIFCE